MAASAALRHPPTACACTQTCCTRPQVRNDGRGVQRGHDVWYGILCDHCGAVCPPGAPAERKVTDD